MKPQIKTDAYRNKISNRKMEPNLENKSHRSKLMHMSMKFQIKIDAYVNEIL